MELRAGSMISDEVRLAKPLPLAHSGKLWLADQLDWKKKVVVKIVRNVKAIDDDDLARFLETASMAQELDSQHVARVFDFGVSDDFTPFVVMEFLKGETLSARLRKKDRLDAADAGRVVSQVADALTAAHGLELAHLGLSPDNVYLCESGTIDVKVLNFGISCHGAVDRSSEYTSPEQYLGRGADYRADLWALGAIAYLMLTGQHAVDIDQRRLMDWEFEPPSEMWLTDVPPEVDAWFVKALHRDPAKRFESASAMAESFAHLIPELAHLARSVVPTPSVEEVKVVEVGTPAAPSGSNDNLVVQDMTEDSPGITIDVDD
jgi:serine/threonine-protein kinase